MRWKMVNKMMMEIILGMGLIKMVRANNLEVTNVTLVNYQYPLAVVKFDIQWKNSWRFGVPTDPLYFHDATWTFFKIQRQNEEFPWQHGFLERSGTNPPGFSVGSGTSVELVVPPDRLGMLIRRAEEGAGTTSVQNVQVVMNMASSGVSRADAVRIQVFGVEMVYVPNGPFWVGDGGTGGGRFTLTQITTHVANVVGGYPTGQSPPNANWPNGYNAFYCMKYEISEGQWVDFFNTLTDNQKITRDITGPSGKNSDNIVNRCTVAWTSGDATTLRPNRACGYLSPADICAFFDWAGLRPMTELEFEKACRGPLEAVPYEYAWGTTTIRQGGSLTISGTENGMETVITDVTGGGCHYGSFTLAGGDGGYGPLRVGIFATNGATRVSAGASYWGIMELSGNLWELVVDYGSSDYTGLHGDGQLDLNGNANVSNWPTSSMRIRGGSYQEGGTAFLQTSNRQYSKSARENHLGGRGVRTSH